jgi:hypothetical protein
MACLMGCCCPSNRTEDAWERESNRGYALGELRRLLRAAGLVVQYGARAVRVEVGPEHVELPYSPAVLAELSAAERLPPVEPHETWSQRKIVGPRGGSR